MTHNLIITGSTRGIGYGLALHYLNKDDTIVIGLGRSVAGITHHRYQHIALDLSNFEEVEAAFDRIFPSLQAGDGVTLVNNAGMLGDVGHLGTIDRTSFRKVMDVNVSAVAQLMDAFISRYAAHHGRKTILNISSGAGKSPVDGWAAYCASKAALDMLSMVTAEECRIDGNDIRIFAVAPGVVDTAMQTEIREAAPSGFSKIQKFINLKNEGLLSSSEKTAGLLAKVIEQPDKFNEVHLDVRAF